MAEDLSITAREYESGLLENVKHVAEDGSYWERDGVSVTDVRLEGAYPATELVRVFRLLPRSGRSMLAECRFGFRERIWPAIERDPDVAASRHSDTDFMEYLGSNSFWDVARSAAPCDPDAIVWLNQRPEVASRPERPS
jgi:hypothetical protein